MSLPDSIPIFPLPNVVLFPEVELPLHIFEPRYREMVADAMAGDGLIGMVLLRPQWGKDYYEAPPVYPIGCVGRIEQHEALADGRSNLVLRGERAFDNLDQDGDGKLQPSEVILSRTLLKSLDRDGDRAIDAAELKLAVRRRDRIVRRARELGERLKKDEAVARRLAAVEPELTGLLSAGRLGDAETLLDEVELHALRGK